MRPQELDARGRRLRAALAAVLVRDRARELDLVHQWLDTWAGLGLVVAGMTHQGWDVQLTAYAGSAGDAPTTWSGTSSTSWSCQRPRYRTNAEHDSRRGTRSCERAWEWTGSASCT
jgi:hypothetical protein